MVEEKYVDCFFGSKIFFTKNYFLTAEINLTNRGPLYTCLVIPKMSKFDSSDLYVSGCYFSYGARLYDTR